MDGINERRIIMNGIMKLNETKLIGRLLRHIWFMAIVAENKINGKRTKGKPR